LDTIVDDRHVGKYYLNQLCDFVGVSLYIRAYISTRADTTGSQNAELQNRMTVRKYDDPTTWRLTKNADAHSDIEESVMRVQGVLCLKDLPPITNRLR
jgi:hypothetical protein